MLGEWAGKLWVRILWASILLLAWLVSLFLPVVFDGTGKDLGVPGLFVAALGWIGIFQGQFGWFGNFGILAAIILLLIGRRVQLPVALFCAIPTLACFINTAMWREYPNGTQLFTVKAYGSGYWLWMAIVAASMLAMLAMVRPIRPASR